jgi:hypothetical protein
MFASLGLFSELCFPAVYGFVLCGGLSVCLWRSVGRFAADCDVADRDCCPSRRIAQPLWQIVGACTWQIIGLFVKRIVGLFLADCWCVFGGVLVCLWRIVGLSVADCWSICGGLLVCLWRIVGMFVADCKSVCGGLLVCLWRIVGIFVADC